MRLARNMLIFREALIARSEELSGGFCRISCRDIMYQHCHVYRAALRDMFCVRRQVFCQKRQVMGQKIVLSASNAMWQALPSRRCWCKMLCHISCRVCKRCFPPRRRTDFPVQRRHELRQKAPLPSTQRAGKHAHRYRRTIRHLCGRRVYPLFLYEQGFAACGDSNPGRETTLILTINRDHYRRLCPSLHSQDQGSQGAAPTPPQSQGRHDGHRR